jgi:hypothetical protein
VCDVRNMRHYTRHALSLRDASFVRDVRNVRHYTRPALSLRDASFVRDVRNVRHYTRHALSLRDTQTTKPFVYLFDMLNQRTPLLLRFS